MTPKISIIAAIGENRELGRNNKLLWHIPEDLKRFKKITQDHPVIMGRKTFESIGKALPKRLNIIITRDSSYSVKNAIVCDSLEEGIKAAKAKETSEIFIIGGGSIYKQAISHADKLYLTIIEGKYKADTYFPDYSDFKTVVFEKSGESGGYKYKFLELTE